MTAYSASNDNDHVGASPENASGISKWVKRLEIEKGSDGLSAAMTNVDLLPVPPEGRTWVFLTYVLFWFGECASVTSWTVAATGVKAGLSWYEAWICVVFGHWLVAIPLVMTGRPGATYHIPFPVIARASFGIWGSYWPLINRNAMTIIWSGVQMVTTGNCFYVMLHAIFPSIAHIPNVFPKDVTMHTGRLIGFILAWICVIGCAYIRPQKLSGLIIIKSGIMMVCLIIFFAWSLVKANGIGPIIHQGASIPKGKSHAWVFLSNFFIQAGNMATFATNNADISRYARKPKDALWTQFFGMPIAFGVIAFFGIFVTSASKVIFGEVQWDPNLILDGFLTQSYDPKTRCGVFFIALGFSFAQVTTMIFANLIAAGNDTSAMWPKYINYRRGAIICMIIAFAINPWNLTKTSFAFTSYLGAYQIFLSNIIGVIISDYFFVRKGNYDIAGLFSTSHTGTFWYSQGWNWRAYAAYFAGIIPVFPGFLAQVGVKGVPLGAQRLYIFALPVGICVSASVYWGLCMWSPVEGMAHKGTTFEGLVGQYDYDNANDSPHGASTVEVSDKKV
ncbi:NCS1 nucleoside transporter family [Melanomma pulvis-pyrius CBS 109.77]|uniref:NCS1 nucleoside transporter family n=1 Tax=Melanomma pulvis-pyrius CBS 109.77 TaxID=1314802 RepID=A0A6A6XDZ8_9PLEO|nr:NCS1 nucleoside transporter family [Melanomma pulvis-pyrius CBS 109.77]